MEHTRIGATVKMTVLSACVLAGACSADRDVASAEHEPGSRIQGLLDGRQEAVLTFPDGDTVRLGKEVAEFYEERNFVPAWTSREGFLPRGEALVAALHGADEEGLSQADYHRSQVHELIDRARQSHGEDVPVGELLGTLDVLLTEAFLRYTTDVRRGTVDPESVGLQWEIPREDATDHDFLDHLLAADADFERALAELRPAVPFYGRLKEGLARYRRIEEGGGWPTVDEGETLEEGMSDERVRQLRRRLSAERDPDELALVQRGRAPDSFDADLAAAVAHFQERHGIDPDGRVGSSTLKELNVPLQERIRALKLNLDRWRWLPRDLGKRYVLVNVAGFEMAVMAGDEPELTMNVVVGQEGWETPIFRDTLQYVVVNPYWNVPRSIAKDEVIPAATADRGYLARRNFEVVDPSGRAVDPGSADLRSDRYSIRQRPGPGNALGAVKFLFPNDHNIYLHDTPAGDLFQRTGRAFSHGCIRVERPHELAEHLFRTSTDRPASDYRKLRDSRKEAWVTLDDPLPVYILYFTAWADEDGTVRFYRDVYGRDAQVASAQGRLDGQSGTPLAPSL